MKKLFALCFGLVGIACAAAPEDTAPEPTVEEAKPADTSSEEDVESQSEALSTCRWATVGCCNFGKAPRRAWQCFYAGSWHTSYTRCATELRCAL